MEAMTQMPRAFWVNGYLRKKMSKQLSGQQRTWEKWKLPLAPESSNSQQQGCPSEARLGPTSCPKACSCWGVKEASQISLPITELQPIPGQQEAGGEPVHDGFLPDRAATQREGTKPASGQGSTSR